MIKNIKMLYFLLFFIIAISTLILARNWPELTRLISIHVLLISIGLMVGNIFKNHRQAYQRAECTREKMVRNLGFDLFGLLLTMGAAMYFGRLAGGYFGLRAGFWIGLISGFLGGFAAAWAVRSAWGRWVKVSV